MRDIQHRRLVKDDPYRKPQIGYRQEVSRHSVVERTHRFLDRGFENALALVLGLLGAWQRNRLVKVNTRINERMGALGKATNKLQSARGYLIGGLVMAAGGAIILTYAVVSGR